MKKIIQPYLFSKKRILNIKGVNKIAAIVISRIVIPQNQLRSKRTDVDSS